MHLGTEVSGSKSGRLPLSWRVILLLVPCTLSIITAFRLHHHPAVIVWEPQSLRNCQETSCLYHTPFSTHIPFDEAGSAHKYLRAYLDKNVTTSIPRLLQTATKIPECSVVGGAPSTRDAFYAKIIDSAPTIRLNVRHPSFLAAEGLVTSLGERTDILVVQRGALRYFERYINGWGHGNRSKAIQRRLAGEKVKQNRPLLLYRTECPSRFQACPNSLKALNISTIPDWLPFWFLHPDIEISTRTTLQRFGLLPSQVPTTGITAIILALRLCTRVNVFAMNGPTKGDRDFKDLAVWNGHRLDIERKFIRWLSTCPRFQSRWCGHVRVFS